MKPRDTHAARLRPAFALLLGLFAGAGCDRLQQQGPIPTYPDSKLDAMRSVTGATLPHDPHGAASAAAPALPAAGASATAAPR